MSGILAKYNYIVNEVSDPRVSEWLFMSSPLTIFTILGLYLYIVLKIGPKFMENRKPFNLKNVIQVYNIIQVICCVALIYGVATSGWTTDFNLFDCVPIDYSNKPMAVRLLKLVWWTMILKMVELIETIFFVLRKKYKQVSILHLYHHTSTLLIAWLGCKYCGGGMATFSIMINSFIHVLMYTYYFLSTLGSTWQKKLEYMKPKLTLLQMIQFCIILGHSSIALREDCPVPNIMVYIYIPNVLLVFYLFYGFYNQTYLKKTKKHI